MVFPLLFPLDLRPVAFCLVFLLAVVEALSASAGVAGGVFVGLLVGRLGGVVEVVLFHDLFLGNVAEDRATAVPGVLFDFLAPPTSFFAFFRGGIVEVPDCARLSVVLVSSNFASKD